MSEKLRVAFFQDKFSVGGIQRSLLNLLNNLDYEKYDAELFLFDRENFFPEELPEKLKIIYKDPLPRAFSFLPFGLALRRTDMAEYGHYDAAIDFNSYQVSCAACAIKCDAARHISWIHNDVGVKLANEWKYRVLWNAFKGKFGHFDGYAAVSDGLAEPFSKASHVDKSKISVINNYIDGEDILRRAGENPDGFPTLDENCLNLAAMGHLNHQKGYDIMLDTFGEAVKLRPELRLYILGDGELRPVLEAQRDRLGLAGRVFFLGYAKNPFAFLSRCDGLLSTSRYEGQPLNLMEALALGLPVYCTENLEKYCSYVKGSPCLPEALAKAQKPDRERNRMNLDDYNAAITERFDTLVCPDFHS